MGEYQAVSTLHEVIDEKTETRDTGVKIFISNYNYIKFAPAIH